MSREPLRIQRKRTKGWRMPAGAVYVGRPTRWGNPYVVWSTQILVHPDGRDWFCPDGARAHAVACYRSDLGAGLLPFTEADVRRDLAGRDLVCWCSALDPCHADVLLEIARAAS